MLNITDTRINYGIVGRSERSDLRQDNKNVLGNIVATSDKITKMSSEMSEVATLAPTYKRHYLELGM